MRASRDVPCQGDRTGSPSAAEAPRAGSRGCQPARANIARTHDPTDDVQGPHVYGSLRSGNTAEIDVAATWRQRPQSTILGLTMASAVKSTSAWVGRRARVLAVDDSPSFLALLGDLIRATARLEVAGEALSGERAVELAQALRPDMALMDVRMPGLGGIAAARCIKTSHPSMVVVLISTTHPGELAPEAFEVGADAVIWKNDLDPTRLDETWRRYRARPA